MKGSSGSDRMTAGIRRSHSVFKLNSWVILTTCQRSLLSPTTWIYGLFKTWLTRVSERARDWSERRRRQDSLFTLVDEDPRTVCKANACKWQDASLSLNLISMLLDTCVLFEGKALCGQRPLTCFLKQLSESDAASQLYFYSATLKSH